MGLGVMRLAMGAFWLAVAAAVLVPQAGVRDRIGEENAGTAVLLAVALAGWNLTRWYFGRTRPAPRPTRLGSRPLRRDGDRAEEYNPELDFTKRDGGV